MCVLELNSSEIVGCELVWAIGAAKPKLKFCYAIIEVNAAVYNSPVLVIHFLFSWFLWCRCIYGTHKYTVYLTNTNCISRFFVNGRTCACSPWPHRKCNGTECKHDGGHAHIQWVCGKCTNWCGATAAECDCPPRWNGGTDGCAPE